MDARKITGDDFARTYAREMEDVRLTEERKRQLIASLAADGGLDGSNLPGGGGEDVPCAALPTAETPSFANTAPSDGGRSGRSRAIRRTAVLLAAAFVVLCGFAAARYGQEAWREWFGTDAAADRLESVSVTADYGDVHMEVPSVVADANGMYLLLQMRDAEGRIDGPVDLFPIDMRVNGEFASSEGQIVSFDEATGTLNVVLKVDGQFPAGAAGELTLTNIRDAPREHECLVDVGPLAAVPEVGAPAFIERPGSEGELSHGQFDGVIEWGASMPEPGDDASAHELFASQTMEAPIAGDKRIAVVGMGYRDGELHVLMRNEAEGLAFAQLLLRSRGTGEWLWPIFSIDYCYAEDWAVRDLRPDDTYEVPKVVYSDFTFKIDKEDLEGYDLWSSGDLADWEICGRWKVPFKVPEMSASDVLTASTTVPDEVLGAIDQVTVTPFSVGLHGQRVTDWGDFAPEVSLVYRDGTTRPYEGMFDDHSQTPEELAGDSRAATLSSIGNVGNFEEIVAIEVNGVRIALRE